MFTSYFEKQDLSVHLSRRILIAELQNMGCCEGIAKEGVVGMVSVQVS